MECVGPSARIDLELLREVSVPVDPQSARLIDSPSPVAFTVRNAEAAERPEVADALLRLLRNIYEREQAGHQTAVAA
jgi:hypothetical protein